MAVKTIGKPKEPSTLIKHFSELKDPRKGPCEYHLFTDILVIAICAIISGADDYVAIADYGKAKEKWFREFLKLPNGIPAHDTFWRVFEALDPEQFQKCFVKWVSGIRKSGFKDVICVDGKRLRRSYSKEDDKAAIHMVSAWAAANRLVLGQQKVDEKSNEITAIPELLRALDINGCLVTIDAMGCQREIANLIREGGADYLLSLKGNQSNLHEDVILLFDDLAQSDFTAYEYDHAVTVDKGHGRIETRHCWTISDPALISCLRGANKWRDLTTVVKVQAERYVNGKYSIESRYFIASSQECAASLLTDTRRHWHIENSLHWVLDIAFREDECRIRKGNGPQNFAILRHIALNLLKQETSSKSGIKNRRLRAGWDDDYLLSVLEPLIS